MTSPEPAMPDPSFPAYGPPPPVPPRPKGKAVLVLSIVAVLMLGGAVAFAALWIVERGNHDKTTEQLSTKDTELANEKKAHDGTKTKLSEAEKAKTDADAKVTALTPCAEAGKELARLALAAANEADATKAGGVLIVACKP